MYVCQAQGKDSTHTTQVRGERRPHRVRGLRRLLTVRVTREQRTTRIARECVPYTYTTTHSSVRAPRLCRCLAYVCVRATPVLTCRTHTYM